VRIKQRKSDTKYVLISERVAKFAHETFREKDGELFCEACGKAIAMKKSIIQGHIEGARHTKNIATHQGINLLMPVL
jgi:hypothetical protein